MTYLLFRAFASRKSVQKPVKTWGRITTTLGLCVALLGSGCSSSVGSPDARQNNQYLREVLATPLPTIGGPQRKLKDFSGKIVMLHFFSSWCSLCGLEAPSLRNLQMSFKDSRFTVVGVAVDDDPFQAQTFAAKHSLNFPVLLDISGDLKTFFGITELPATLFLDSHGVPIRFQDPDSGSVTAKIEGARTWDASKPVEMIAGLVETL